MRKSTSAGNDDDPEQILAAAKGIPVDDFFAAQRASAEEDGVEIPLGPGTWQPSGIKRR